MCVDDWLAMHREGQSLCIPNVAGAKVPSFMKKAHVAALICLGIVALVSVLAFSPLGEAALGILGVGADGDALEEDWRLCDE
jgi:hypothetical protein